MDSKVESAPPIARRESKTWRERASSNLSEREVDPNWIEGLPPGSNVVTARDHGASAWARFIRLETTRSSGDAQSYFIKLARGEAGREMVKGEFESLKTLYDYSRDMEFVPKPIRTGTLRNDADCHYVMMEFVEMTEEPSEMAILCKKLAELHKRSLATTDTKQFGFQVTNFNGCVPQYNIWKDSWEAFFSDGLRHLLEIERVAHGRSVELENLSKPLFHKVIPRLLRPLETEGRVFKPCLVHADVWEGSIFRLPSPRLTFHGYRNVGVTADDNTYVFDSAAFWGHNEFDLAMWAKTRYRFGKTWIKEYRKYFSPSEPEEDREDRLALYSIRVDLTDSALYPLTQKFRRFAMDTMQRLVDKYPRGYEGPGLRKDIAMAEGRENLEVGDEEPAPESPLDNSKVERNIRNYQLLQTFPKS